MTFKIEKNVPAPTSTGRQKYPFGKMKVGDSFLINGDANPKLVGSAATSFGRAMGRGWKFSTQRTPDGYRCWRIQ